jgi:hypothetical protein
MLTREVQISEAGCPECSTSIAIDEEIDRAKAIIAATSSTVARLRGRLGHN